jgi:hypothetical protein
MTKEKIKFLRSIDPRGLEQDVNDFIDREARSVIDIFFINTVTGHGNEIYYDAYVRYASKSRSVSSKEERTGPGYTHEGRELW